MAILSKLSASTSLASVKAPLIGIGGVTDDHASSFLAWGSISKVLDVATLPAIPKLYPPGPDPDSAAPAGYLLDGSLTYRDGDGGNRADGGPGDDRMYGGGGHDELHGGGGNDQLFGGHGNDTLTVTSGTNSLYGGSGDDILLGGDGTDFLFGGTNSATYFGSFLNGEKGDVMNGGGGNDFLYLDGFNAGQNSNGAGGGSYLASGGEGDDNFIVGDALYGRLNGGTGQDDFIFTQAFHGRAEIMDFNRGEGDKLVFDKEVTSYGYIPGQNGAAGYSFYEFEGGGRVEVHGFTPAELQSSIWNV